ncbi:rhodanese-like domain-containing protein [Gimibacter soli]|uniref:Rhodanese-like domain-containing protein n=1 Tax=Gimibacter soli TaxID=3024400 RepID=A0AAE9XPJ9_9PROT|nr:rhodanese-like domain-containing protein [Gimibacter soli]WCL52570.1 rhodanese-like domain-containing protein [Gimibacter soli]
MSIRSLRRPFLCSLLMLFLSGCLLESFRLPEDYRAANIGAVLPWDAATLFAEDGGQGLYLRFVPVGKTSYALEQVATDPKSGDAAMTVLTAHLNPLGGDWYALHWVSHDRTSQGYNLLHVGKDLLRVVVPAGAMQRIAETAATYGGKAEVAGSDIGISGMEERQVLALLGVAKNFAGYSFRNFRHADAYPADVASKAYASIVEPVMRLKPADFGGSAGLYRMTRYFFALAEEERAVGYYALARFAASGWGLTRDEAFADDMAAKAVAGGVAQATTVRGYLRLFGRTTPADYPAAVDFLRAGMAAGESRAPAYLGFAYRNELGVDYDEAEAIRLYEAGAARADPFALTERADMMIADPGRSRNKARIIELLERAAAHDSLHAMYMLGEVYEWEPETWPKAVGWYRRAAFGGHAEAQAAYGRMLDMGIGGTPDPAAARHWIRLAAVGGSETAADEMVLNDWSPLVTMPGAGAVPPKLHLYELQDWGVPADARDKPDYRESPQTPLVAPGARTIATYQLKALIDEGGRPLLIDVNRTAQHGRMPGAVIKPDLGYWPSDGRLVSAALEGLTSGDRTRPLVFFCAGSECWYSWFAARAAVELGYEDVLWYRGGISSWRAAGHAVTDIPKSE